LAANQFEWEIKPDQGWFRFGLKELFYKKGLILRFVRRDLLASYQQTLIGPLWIVLQPLLATLVYVIIFSKVARLSTDGTPPLLFYLSGYIIWNFFTDCLNGTMYTFIFNAHIFNKVYFPRLIIPFSAVITASIRGLIQCVFFLLLLSFYDHDFPQINISMPGILWLLFFMVVVGLFAVGLGLIISVLTARYRDIDNLIQFALRLFMFAAPVVYPASMIPNDYQTLFWLNPLTTAIEGFRGAFLTGNPIEMSWIWLSLLVVSLICFIGVTIFKKLEIKVLDTL
jgi:lipopolysaccharide transport system permease protein